MAVTMAGKTPLNNANSTASISLSGSKLPKIRVDQPVPSSGASTVGGVDNDLSDRLSIVGGRFSRGSSPVPDYLWGKPPAPGLLPSSSSGFLGKRLAPNRGFQLGGRGDLTPCGAPGPEPEDETELIKDCGMLSAALGLPRSFSASDLLTGSQSAGTGGQKGAASALGASMLFIPGGRGSRLIDQELRNPLRQAVSELTLKEAPSWGWWWRGMMDGASRSCSTWVAVGDAPGGGGLGGSGLVGAEASSQLPSPQATPSTASFLAPADLLRSVNKKLRGDYIRRRMNQNFKLLTALGFNRGDLAQHSQQQLFKLLKKTVTQNPSALLGMAQSITSGASCDPAAASTMATVASPSITSLTSASTAATVGTTTAQPAAAANPASAKAGAGTLTAKDIERDAGKPLTKYERNMMIFTWLQTLQEGTPVTSASMASIAGLDVQP